MTLPLIGGAQATARIIHVTLATQPSPNTSIAAATRGRRRATERPESSGFLLRRASNGTTTGSSACRSEEHTSELQSLMRISYAVFCLKKTTHRHYAEQYTTHRDTRPTNHYKHHSSSSP